MPHQIKNVLLFSLTSLTMISLLSAARANDPMTIPTLEGGLVASVGTFYAIGSADNQDYVASINGGTENGRVTALEGLDPQNNDNTYQFGIEASLGYIFNKTANGLELSYRGLNSSSKDSTSGTLNVNGEPSSLVTLLYGDNNLEYEYNDADMLLTQYLNLGRRLQGRLSAGVAYFELEQTKYSAYNGYSGKSLPFVATQKSTSKYQGLGPRLGFDGRYALGNGGFGFLAGVSTAFFLGDLDLKTVLSGTTSQDGELSEATLSQKDDRDNVDVFNVNGNIAVDYVYTMKNKQKTNIGVEVGYRVDYYNDAVGELGEFIVIDAGDKPDATAEPPRAGFDAYTTEFFAATFSGPYLDIKAAF